MSLFISVTISGKEGIGILFISGRVAAIIAALLGRLSLDLLDIFISRRETDFLEIL